MSGRGFVSPGVFLVSIVLPCVRLSVHGCIYGGAEAII